MKRVHLLRVEKPVVEFAPLFTAARQEGMEIGWLELADPQAPAEVSPALEAGASRTVIAGSRLTLAGQSRKGSVVMRDLIRQHFLGCGAVLVQGDVEAPLLTLGKGGWVVAVPDGPQRHFDTATLLATLRRPRPFVRARGES